jgi:hypothetical protein
MPAWRVVWPHATQAALRALPSWKDAARVAAAVQRFASGEREHVERLRSDPRGLWLRIPGYTVRLALDPKARVITVWYVWRANR